MSLTTISSSTRLNPIIRVFSKNRVRELNPNNLDSNTSLFKSSFAGSESDGEYETSSEGQLHPGPETRPSLYRTHKSGLTVVVDDLSFKAEVPLSTELEVEVIRDTTNDRNGAKAEDSVEATQDVISQQPNSSNVSVHPIRTTGELVPSILESWNHINNQCYPSVSVQTLQSMDTQSNLALSTAKTSTTDLLSVYKEKKFQLDTNSHSIESDSAYKVEQNRLRPFEKHETFADGCNLAPTDIGKNSESCSIYPNHARTNANYGLKKNLIKKLNIMSHIEKELAPLQEKINKIFNQVRIDLRGLPDPLGVSKSAYFLPNDDSIFEKYPVRCHTQVSTSAIKNPCSSSFLPSLHDLPSAEYKLDPSNAYRIKRSYVPEKSPQEKLRLDEKWPYHPFKNVNHLETHSCFNKKHSPWNFGNCRTHLNNEMLTLGNAHLQNSLTSNSSYNLRGHSVPYVTDNSHHISLNNFPALQQHLHSFHRNVLPVNSENLDRHYRSKISHTLETSNSKAHTESKSISNRNDIEDADKPTMICCSRHRHSVNKKESRKSDSSLTDVLGHVHRCKKHKSNESSSTYRPRPFSRRRRCKCNHRCGLRNQKDPCLSRTENSLFKSISPETVETPVMIENQSLSNHELSKNETQSLIDKPSQLIVETVPFEEISNQQAQDFSESTIELEIKFSLDDKHVSDNNSTDGEIELESQNTSNVIAEDALETEESSSFRKISDHDQKKSSIVSCCSHISKSYTESKEPIQVTEHNASYDKACNTESIDVSGQQNTNLLYTKKPALNKLTEVTEKTRVEVPNFKQPLRVDEPKKIITITSLQSRLPEMGGRKSIAIVPITFNSGISEPLNEKFLLLRSGKSENTHQKRIPLYAECQGRLFSDSDSSLSTQAESFATEITYLAEKCAFISDSRGRINSRTTLNTESSSYSFIKSLDSQIRIQNRTKASYESRIKNTSSRNIVSNETSKNPTKNSVAIRRIRGIRTSPEDFMYE